MGEFKLSTEGFCCSQFSGGRALTVVDGHTHVRAQPYREGRPNRGHLKKAKPSFHGRPNRVIDGRGEISHDPAAGALQHCKTFTANGFGKRHDRNASSLA